MSELSQADQYLIEQIRQGSQDGWSQLVKRYQGRLVAFARGQLRDRSEAEDVVQETFLGFLKGVDRFHTRASLETYLFTILRRRLIDVFRRRGRRDEISVCSLQDSVGSQRSGSSRNLDDAFPGHDPSASWRAERNEQKQQQEEALWQALRQSIERLRSACRFRDLQIFEMVFYAQLRNKEIAAHLGMDEKQVALVKHRFIKRLAEQIGRTTEESQLADESMLTRLWEEHRPSCPKRSTVGKLVLGTLEPAWQDYITFHIEVLGCRFCQANLDDLRHKTVGQPSESFRHRIMQSSVGFFRTDV